MIIHGVSKAQCERLAELFATLAPQGWIIPPWLTLLMETARK